MIEIGQKGEPLKILAGWFGETEELMPTSSDKHLVLIDSCDDSCVERPVNPRGLSEEFRSKACTGELPNYMIHSDLFWFSVSSVEDMRLYLTELAAKKPPALSPNEALDAMEGLGLKPRFASLQHLSEPKP